MAAFCGDDGVTGFVCAAGGSRNGKSSGRGQRPAPRPSPTSPSVRRRGFRGVEPSFGEGFSNALAEEWRAASRPSRLTLDATLILGDTGWWCCLGDPARWRRRLTRPGAGGGAGRPRIKARARVVATTLPCPCGPALRRALRVSRRRAIDNFRFEFMRHFKSKGGCGKSAESHVIRGG